MDTALFTIHLLLGSARTALTLVSPLVYALLVYRLTVIRT